jgi:hypothetical protein
MHTEYESPKPIDKSTVLHAIESNDIELLKIVCINLGFNSDDADFLQETSQTLSQHPNTTVRSNALLGLEYSARFLGSLDQSLATTVLSGAIQDSDPHVRSRADDVVESINLLMNWNLPVSRSPERS